MLIQTLKKLYRRDLEQLKKEIESYSDEEKIWLIEKSIANSAGNLCLHLYGNLNTYIGKELGKTNYVRNRDLEFSLKDVPRKDLIQKINETIVLIERTLGGLTQKQLDEDYPIIVFSETMSTEYFLVHLATHLAYHLGQVNYHRRLLDRP